jgi:hypothetical protein
MGRPRRARNISFALSLIGVACIAAAWLLDKFKHPSWITPGLAGCGINLTIIGLAFAIWGAIDTRRMRRLREGIDVLAKWTVKPADWQAFLDLNARLNTIKGNKLCVVAARLDPNSDGVEVIAGKSAILIGEDFHALPLRGIVFIAGPYWHDGPPGCLEFILTSTGRNTSTWSLRIPVAKGAEGDARLVYDHYHARVPPWKPRNFRLIRNISLAVALLCAAMFGAAMMAREKSPQSVEVLVAAIIGAITCPAALIFALISHLMRKRNP